METQLAEHSQIRNKIQLWTQLIEQKNNDRIVKRRDEMDNKLEAFLKEIMTSKTTSTVSNPRSETNETQNKDLKTISLKGFTHQKTKAQIQKMRISL